MLLDKFQYLPGNAWVGTDVTMIHFPVAQLFHLCILGWHDANSDLRRLAQVRTVERNRRNWPTPQSLPSFLAQALEEAIFHHIASLSEPSVHDRCRSRALRYSITSSARASRVGGTSRSSALAVLRLITSSNFVGCKIGRSAGFAPLGYRRSSCRWLLSQRPLRILKISMNLS